MRPDIFTAVIGAVVPVRWKMFLVYLCYTDILIKLDSTSPQRMPSCRSRHLLEHYRSSYIYQLYFDRKLDAAIAELDHDIRRTIRATLRTVESPPPDEYLKSSDSFLDAWGHVKEVC